MDPESFLVLLLSLAATKYSLYFSTTKVPVEGPVGTAFTLGGCGTYLDEARHSGYIPRRLLTHGNRDTV